MANKQQKAEPRAIQIPVLLSVETVRSLDDIAAAEQTSRADIVRRAIRRYMVEMTGRRS